MPMLFAYVICGMYLSNDLAARLQLAIAQQSEDNRGTLGMDNIVVVAMVNAARTLALQQGKQANHLVQEQM